MKKLNLKTFLRGNKVVGVITSLADLYIALANPDIADIYEWRVDSISYDEVVDGLQYLRLLGKLVILTVRDPAEGGQKPDWGIWYRQILMLEYLHVADLIDIEALNAIRLRYVIAEAKKLGIGVIISCHFLKGMPFIMDMLWAWDVYEGIGGDIFKVASKVENSKEMTSFSKWVMPLMRDSANKWRIAPMATGETYGPSSRIKFAKKGAILVYGFLAQAVIKGQLSVQELRYRLAKANLQ
jgi:3-dehydroquinate dehydratase type I